MKGGGVQLDNAATNSAKGGEKGEKNDSFLLVNSWTLWTLESLKPPGIAQRVLAQMLRSRTAEVSAVCRTRNNRKRIEL
jgi:hypothetical protein